MMQSLIIGAGSSGYRHRRLINGVYKEIIALIISLILIILCYNLGNACLSVLLEE